MNILQTVVVKQVLTETSKQVLLNKFELEKSQLQKESEQLRFEMRKLEKSKKMTVNSFKNRFENEIHTRLEKIKLLDFKIEQLHMLPLGSELKEKECQAVVEVNVGDAWEDIQTEKTIIIKDGIVDEIR
ncbi:YlqD family protein [Robertmurraya korlensis]|uniref:YlqD family protein n=1 Tax=Robertmurraya korlensis TaxID=519977 RepID=UPI00203C4142|nr:YlqD family protein [Robertmurraya korlensis]MCM3600213.1 YlqD family protein [Robertmurraya korlensis]